MSNPNNCTTCDHKKHPDGGHCYMFKLAPTSACSHHTFNVEAWRAVRMQFVEHIAARAAAKGE